jgi:hypothetical protein
VGDDERGDDMTTTNWDHVLRRALLEPHDELATATDWRDLACELANVSAELVTLARAVSDDRPGDFVHGMLGNNAHEVSAVVDKVVAAVKREGHV